MIEKYGPAAEVIQEGWSEGEKMEAVSPQA
jgi:hypothetical protein